MPQDPRHLRILIVDDNQDMADSAVDLLLAAGHDARAMYTGQEAVLVATAFAPHLILLDLDMPGDDGFEVLRRLRLAQHLAPARIVALTGHGGDDYVARTTQAGFDAHFMKPLTAEGLQRLIGDVPL